MGWTLWWWLARGGGLQFCEDLAGMVVVLSSAELLSSSSSLSSREAEGKVLLQAKAPPPQLQSASQLSDVVSAAAANDFANSSAIGRVLVECKALIGGELHRNAHYQYAALALKLSTLSGLPKAWFDVVNGDEDSLVRFVGLDLNATRRRMFMRKLEFERRSRDAPTAEQALAEVERRLAFEMGTRHIASTLGAAANANAAVLGNPNLFGLVAAFLPWRDLMRWGECDKSTCGGVREYALLAWLMEQLQRATRFDPSVVDDDMLSPHRRASTVDALMAVLRQRKRAAEFVGAVYHQFAPSPLMMSLRQDETKDGPKASSFASLGFGGGADGAGENEKAHHQSRYVVRKMLFVE